MSIPVTSEYIKYNQSYNNDIFKEHKHELKKRSEACWAPFSPGHGRRIHLKKLILHDLKVSKFSVPVLANYFDAISKHFWNVTFDADKRTVEIHPWDKRYRFPVNTGGVILWIGHMCRYPFLESKEHKAYVDYFKKHYIDDTDSSYETLLKMHDPKHNKSLTYSNHALYSNVHPLHYAQTPEMFVKLLATQKNVETYLNKGFSYENIL